MMTRTRSFSGSRRAGLLGAAILGLAALAPAAMAQDAYPSKALKLVVPYTAGGATDIIGRTVGQELGKVLAQPVVVDNRAGAAGNIGAAAVAREKPDGYTVLMGAMTSHSINSVLMGQAAGFDMVKSFTPIAIVGRVPLVFVVNPNSKHKSLKELIDFAKANPGKLNYASAGNGSPQHLAGEMFKREIGADIAHVPYKGSTPALTDLMAGQVDFMIDTVPAAQNFIKGGKLVALATTTAQPVASPAGRAHGGCGRAEGLRCQLDVRHRRARQDTGAGGGQAERRAQDRDGASRRQGHAGGPGRRRVLHHAQGGRSRHRARSGHVVEGDQGRQHQA